MRSKFVLGILGGRIEGNIKACLNENCKRLKMLSKIKKV